MTKGIIGQGASEMVIEKKKKKKKKRRRGCKLKACGGFGSIIDLFIH